MPDLWPPTQLEQQAEHEDKMQILERLAELEEQGILEQLKQLQQTTDGREEVIAT